MTIRKSSVGLANAGAAPHSEPQQARERVFINTVHYPPCQRRWDAAREGEFDFYLRLHKTGSVKPVSEYSWQRLMGRHEAAERILQRLVAQFDEKLKPHRKRSEKSLESRELHTFLPAIANELEVVLDDELAEALVRYVQR
jgi:hypothetical protein